MVKMVINMILDLLTGNITQQEVLNSYNATILYKDLPIDVRGYVFCYRCINCIIINKNLSMYKKKHTILHELAHIELNQLNQINNDMFEFYVDKYEDDAEKYLKFIEDYVKELKKKKEYFDEYYNNYYY